MKKSENSRKKNSNSLIHSMMDDLPIVEIRSYLEKRLHESTVKNNSAWRKNIDNMTYAEIKKYLRDNFTSNGIPKKSNEYSGCIKGWHYRIWFDKEGMTSPFFSDEMAKDLYLAIKATVMMAICGDDSEENECPIIIGAKAPPTKKFALSNFIMGTQDGTILRRICALKDFGDVKKGDLGGYVESEHNLWLTGNCWIYDNAKVYGQAVVTENAIVGGNATVKDKALISGNAMITGEAIVCDNAVVGGYTEVCDNAKVSGNTSLFGKCTINKSVCVSDESVITGSSDKYGVEISTVEKSDAVDNSDARDDIKKYVLMHDDTVTEYGIVLYRIKALRDFGDVKAGDLGGFVESEENLSHDGNCWIYDNAKVYDGAFVHGDAKVYSTSRVFGKGVLLVGDVEIKKDAVITGDVVIC